MGKDCFMAEEPEPTDEPGEMQYVEDFLDGNIELINVIVDQLVTNGTSEYTNDSGTLRLVAHRHRWRAQWLEHEFVLPDGRKGSGVVRMDRDQFAPPFSTLKFYVAAHLADMQPPPD